MWIICEVSADILSSIGLMVADIGQRSSAQSARDRPD